MKNIIGYLLVVLLVNWKNAAAITGKNNWKEIISSDGLSIQQPAFSGVFGSSRLFNSCTTDDEFKSIKPVKICLEYKITTALKENGMEIESDYHCSRYETRPVSMSRTYLKNICVRYSPKNSFSQGECIEYDQVTSIYPTAFSLAVIETDKEFYGQLLFLKTFAPQTCQE